MILADKIMEERKKNGWTQEELADKLSVSRQAVSKWESAQSVPDLQRIIQLADLFCVSTDYLLKDDMEAQPVMEIINTNENSGILRKVSMEEANEFLEFRKKSAPRTALAVAMCIISPTLLILLAGLSDDHVGNISENMAAGIGLIFLFAMITIAVFTFIKYGTKEAKYSFLNKEAFETAYGVTGLVKEKQKDYEDTFTRGIAIGVVLCIISSIPLIISGLMEAPDYIYCALTSLLLVLVAAGVYLMVKVGMIRNSYHMLLQEGEFSKSEKKINKKMELISSAYWCIVTAIYLGWSFLTNNWEFTWIVWPVAGVLFAAVSAIAKMVIRNKEE